MKEKTNETKKQNWLTFFNKIKEYYPFILIFISSIIISIPLFSMNLSDYNEFRIHIGRVESIKEVLKEGIFPPLISPKHMNGFGYALNIFYGPLTTYIPILISLIVGSTAMAIKVFTLITLLVSGITMYFFTLKVTQNKCMATISALIYITAPYKLTNIFSRNALGEYSAFMFLPILFNGLYELINEKSDKHYLIIFGAIGLILSHTITTIYSAIFAALYLLFNYDKLKDKKIWKNIFIDIVIILLVCAFYIIPLLECKFSTEYVIYNQERMGTFGVNVYSQTATISDFFSDELLKTDKVILSLGFVSIILTLFTFICYKDVDKKYKNFYIICLIFSIISLFMCTKSFPWICMPQFLTVIQFAWRMLGYFIFFDAFICGVNVFILANKVKSMKYIILAFIVIIIYILSGIRAFNFFSKYNYEEDTQTEYNIMNSTKIGPLSINRDYMPYKAIVNIEYLKMRQDSTYLLNGQAIIDKEDKKELNDTMEISNVHSATLELPYLYYPGYTAKLNGKTINIFESENGFASVKVNENGILKVSYTGTNIEKIGYIISFIGTCILIVFIVKCNKTKI